MYNKMKNCPKCTLDKDEKLFYNNRNNIDGKSRICKKCQGEYDSLNYKENKEKHKQNNIKSKNKKKEWWKNLKLDLKCCKCGEKRWYILDFHHLDPKKKDFHLGDYLHNSMNKILKELKKCIPLCRNCHSEFHYLEKENGIKIEEYLNNE